MAESAPRDEVRPSAPKSAADARLLLVDGDDVSRRFLELALSSAQRFVVEVASDGAGALDILSHAIVDLIVCDVDSGADAALNLLKRVRREPRWRTLPLFFVGAKGNAGLRVSAFQQGVDDVIDKPLSVPELVARIDAVMRRVRMARSKWRGRRYELAGNFRGLCFSDLVTILENGQRSGQLSVLTRRGGGALFFDEGRIRHATFGTLQGPDAIYRLFAEPEGEFEFLPGRAEQEVPQTVSGSATGLLLESARRMDDFDKCPGTFSPMVEGAPDLELLTDPARMPAAADVAALAESLEDPFNLGELALLKAEELGPWLAEGRGSGAMQILLVAPPDSGVLALSALAAPLSEGQISRCLERSSRVLAFSFDAGENCGLNLVLLDPELPLEPFQDTWPEPALLMLAPSGGDWMSLSISARVGLGELLARTQPVVVQALGNDNLASTLSEVLLQTSPASEVHVENVQINDADIDFRELIVNGLRSLERHVAAAETYMRTA